MQHLRPVTISSASIILFCGYLARVCLFTGMPLIYPCGLCEKTPTVLASGAHKNSPSNISEEFANVITGGMLRNCVC